jgi:hypothetical protein
MGNFYLNLPVGVRRDWRDVSWELLVVGSGEG